MKLADCSTFFDRTDILDADTGALLFRGQIKNYDESRRDAVTAYRRVLSVAPGTVIPASRAVRFFGDVWLVGDGQDDGQEDLYRTKYVVQKVQGQAQIYSLAGFLTGTARATVWADMQWLTDRREAETSSNSPQQYVAYIPRTAVSVLHDIIVLNGKAMLAQSNYEAGSGFLELRGILQPQTGAYAAVVNKRQYVPSQGNYLAVASVPYSGFFVRWQELYRYEEQMDERYQEGDFSLALPSSADVTTADTVLVSAREWSVTEVQAISGCKVLHLRTL